MADMHRDRTIGDFPQYPVVRNPSLWQRAVAAFRAQPTMTKSAALAAQIGSEEYNLRKNYYRHVNEDNPAETVWQSGAQFLGKALAQATDPIGLLLARGTGTRTQEAIAGALAQAGESVMDDVASGQQIDRTKAVGNAVAGAMGAPLGGALGERRLGGVVSETLGRVVGSTVVEPYVSSTAGDAIANAVAAPVRGQQGKGRRLFTLKDSDPWK